MAKLQLKPVSDGYSAQQRATVLSVDLDGGAARYRRDQLHGSFLITAKWVCKPEQYDYICAFYRTATVDGSIPFDVSLRLDAEERQDYSCYFVPGSFRLAGQSGRVRIVEAQLEVLKPFDAGQEAADEAIIAAYEAAHGVGP